MRNPLVAATLAAIVAASAIAQPPQRGEREGRRERPRAAPIELTHFEYREVEFPTERIEGGVGRYGIYIPKVALPKVAVASESAAPADAPSADDPDAGREPAKAVGSSDGAAPQPKLPIVVWLHGFGGHREFQSGGAAKTLDDMLGAGDIPPVVLVTFVAPGDRRNRSVYVNGEALGDIEDAIVVDLLAHAQQNFPVSAAREHHGIMGISLGGFAALKIALHHPDTFAAVGAHSSAIFPDDPEQLSAPYAQRVSRFMEMGLGEVFGNPIDKERWAAEMPMGIARRAEPAQFESLAIYFDAGTDDRYGFAEPNQMLSDVMREAKIEHTFRLIEGGGHAFGSDGMLDAVRVSLKFVVAALTAAPAEPAAADVGDEPARGDGTKQQK